MSPFLPSISVFFGGGSVQQFGGPSDDGLGCYVLKYLSHVRVMTL